MGKRYTVEELQLRLDVAKRRRAAKEADRIAAPKPYKPRPASVTLYYRSVFDNDNYYEVKVNSETLALFANPGELGLLATPPTGITPVPIRGSGIKPTLLKWFYGDVNPVVVVTKWGSRYIKNYDQQSGQSHRSIPLSVASGAFGVDDLVVKFNALFGTNGTRKALLGARGIAEMIPEKMPVRS